MKLINYFISLFIFLSLSTSAQSAERRDDSDLRRIFERIKKEVNTLENRRHPELPTNQDIDQLQKALFPNGGDLAPCLRDFHSTLGNVVFSVDFPTIHNNDASGQTYQSELLDFIHEGHDQKVVIPLTWLPFCRDGDAYVCLELGTSKIRYFSRSRHFKDETHDNFSAWLKQRLLNQ
jgi:hypothetical protein